MNAGRLRGFDLRKSQQLTGWLEMLEFIVQVQLLLLDAVVRKEHVLQCHQGEERSMQNLQAHFADIIFQTIHKNSCGLYYVFIDIINLHILPLIYRWVRGNRSRRVTQTSLSPATLSSSSWGTPKHSQVTEDTQSLQQVLGLPQNLFVKHALKTFKPPS